MNQNQIDEQAQNVSGFVAGGLILAILAALRWPSGAIILAAVGAVLYLGAQAINSGYSQYATAVRAEAGAQAAAQEEKEQAKFRMYKEGEALGFAVEGTYWRTVGALSDLERMEIKGNKRAKKFRAQYSLSAQDQPDLSWIGLKDSIEADIAAGDRGFAQTKVKVALAQKKLEPAQRYVATVKENQAHFAGDGYLKLGGAFIKEFSN
ncbi:hypothetical protein [Aquipseudomonas alcaligenes]|uniref:Uncharacterized protein n=1 Tax=Aquipseudomonas alcaligenes (strain ATCC 14909 / DSM 50342 / CCUG 1425 / JCM 20561 / NBRC 14159 / NCIMB 9945 / NCTC 10367 / 1577) TaxID=1215092 RepID=U3AUK9_AQUA1|nr:hypothetical protein [Pseudomonas alcaligenes]GAD61344.1 hypothetical protein PA6_005_02330 [Pseudomonas alcaligenes NBRC 14159]SUD14388.1 Uncharacterised protein [Pseudomonas alcaligenes]